MKRTLKIISLILAVALLCTSFIACGDDKVEDNTPPAEETLHFEVGNQDSGKIVTIVVGGTKEKVYSVDFSFLNITEGPLTVIKYLAGFGNLTYTSTSSDFGEYLTQVNDLKENLSENTSIYLYTSVVGDQDTSAYATTKVWNGNTLVSSGLGISSMTVENGAIIYIGTIKW